MTLTVYTEAHFPSAPAHFLLPSAAGHLEVRTTPFPSPHTSHIGIICHPHPLLGGTMNNKVVTTVERAFKDNNMATVRFNFRGVDHSTGEFGHTKGELEDLITIFNWVKSVSSNPIFTLAGFSFGSFIAASAAQYYPLNRLILIAPPVERFGFHNLPSFQHPWLVIQGDQDTVVTPNAVTEWVKTRSPQGTYQRLPNAEHFFHGQLFELRQCINHYLSFSS